MGDCVFRAIAHATGIPYKQVWNDLLELSKKTLNLPNSEETYGVYLNSKGWYKKSPKRCSKNRTIEVRKFSCRQEAKLHHSHKNTFDCHC